MKAMSRQRHQEWFPAPNLGATKRILTMIAGGVLLASALRRGNFLMGFAGSVLAARGISGFCPAYRLAGHDQRRRQPGAEAVRDRDSSEDDVTLAAEQSFPASDPPSFNPGRA
jgi:hypothetical protein